MINFLYCFDDNYNIPAMCSIYSLLEKVDEKIVINIMHKSLENSYNFPKKILNHKMLSKLNVYKVDLFGNKFPNIEGSHVSEATYYRLFIENYINSDINNLVYLDCDVICVNNPLRAIKSELENISNSQKVVGVLPELSMNNYGERKFNLKNSYFNAGVMMINYRSWKSQNLLNEFVNTINKFSEELKFWDQDVLNIQLNKKYKTISTYFNYKVDMDDYEIAKFQIQEEFDKIYFLHYSGKYKPWSIKGALNLNSEYFHSIYRELYSNNYFFLYNYKKNALNDLLFGFKNLSIFKVKYPVSFAVTTLKSLFRFQ
jgi:lipopolysaccharide biosynthesis glycosyltransferase